MGLFKRLAGILGFAREEEADATGVAEEEDNSDVYRASTVPPAAAAFAAASQAANHLHRKGFSVPVQVPVDRGPILVPCDGGDGGVQGLRWFGKRLKVDEDGDVADEFLDEVLPVKFAGMEENHGSAPTFEVKHSTRPAKVRNQALSLDGKLQHCVEYQGRSIWV